MPERPGAPVPAPRLASALLAATAALGAASLLSELGLLRELASLSGGDERSLGAGLGAWLALGGLGALLGSRGGRDAASPARLAVGLVLLAPLPVVTLVLGRLLLDRVFAPGVAPAPAALVVAAVGWLAPFAVGQGASLSLATAALPGARGLGPVLLADTLGALAAGALFSGVLVTAASPVAVLLGAGVLLAGAALVVAATMRARGVALTAALAALALVVVGLTTALETSTLAASLPGAELLGVAYTGHGRLLVAERAGRRELLLDRTWLAAADDRTHAEVAAALAFAARPRAQRVLVVGGTAAGTPRELLRWGKATVDALEPDPELLAAVERWFPAPAPAPRLTTRAGDARLTLAALARDPGGVRYDVVLVDLPAPTTLAGARYFTAEFVGEVAAVLTPDGVLATTVGRYENHVGPPLAALLAGPMVTTRQAPKESPAGYARGRPHFPGLALGRAPRFRHGGTETPWRLLTCWRLVARKLSSGDERDYSPRS